MRSVQHKPSNTKPFYFILFSFWGIGIFPHKIEQDLSRLIIRKATMYSSNKCHGFSNPCATTLIG